MSKENPTPDEPAAEAWATLILSLRPGTTTRAALAEASDRLDSLGALLASEPGVGGVETRDPSVLEASERPELVVYTTPDRLESILERAARLARALELDLGTATQVHEDDAWRDAWKQFYRPMRFGAAGGRLVIRPSWIAPEPDETAPQLVLDPGRAFGTGLHESTRLCLEVIGDHAGDGWNEILDLGCGSGILGLACTTIHPNCRVTSVDVDPEATATTRENAELNGLEGRVETVTGPVDGVAPGVFDMVIANIRPEVLVPAAAAIRARVRPGGTLLLSGILDEEADAVAEAYVTLGPPLRTSLGEWTALYWDAANLGAEPNSTNSP